MIAITSKNAGEQKPVETKRKGYNLRTQAEADAVATLGEHARRGFEFESRKVDGKWFWFPTDEVKPATPADIKASGGKKSAKAEADLRKEADQRRHEERGRERAEGEGRARKGAKPLAQDAEKGSPLGAEQ